MVIRMEEREMLFFGKQYEFKVLNFMIFKLYFESDMFIGELEVVLDELLKIYRG